ncbi:hypothetical protein [Nocardioides bizhenqiangii]|uniref:Uncharacterized protein n=1 Tax=Nocardioides bizhenqiangii TaxID=3095076 RepID=A0ABZ0ZMZ6_9ACTN|nr:hypothetical protein [Nocardioides sp. HM61]WQQ24977.1 hypothetical protein SHK19_13485 [Nocardioides sp. HM61]
MSNYEVYDAGGGEVPWELREDPVEPRTDDVDGGWMVAVEYSNKGQAKPPTIVSVRGRSHPTREEALAAAQQEAFSYDPPDPFSPQGRRVFRDGPDGFLAVIEGAMTTFHMSVRVVQHIGDA